MLKVDTDALARDLSRGPLLRVVNFHLTPAWRRDQYDRQFALYAKFFAPVTEDDLDAFLASGRWHKEKPGLLPASSRHSIMDTATTSMWRCLCWSAMGSSAGSSS